MLFLTFASTAFAQVDEHAFKEQINANTVTILGGSMSGTYLRFADDIANGIGSSDDLRVLPVRGPGGAQNVRDILYLRGIDMGLVRGDVMETLRGEPHYGNLAQRLHYISVLYLEEFHVWTSKPEIQSIMDLQGKTVAFHNGGEKSGEVVLEKFGIKLGKVISASMFTAADKLKSGEWDAIVRITGKPISDLEKITEINPDLRLLPIPYTNALADTNYVPTTLTHADYPTFIPEGKEVETVGVNAVLAVYNWPANTDRYARLVKFTDAFFSNFNRIIDNKGRHSKWDEVNLASTLKGWQRFKPAEEWFKKQAESKTVLTSADGELANQFKNFLRTKAGAELRGSDNEKLFQAFLSWRKNPQ